MIAAPVYELRLFLKKSLSLVLVFSLFNLLLQLALSDFWQQPQTLTTKIGVYAYENMVMLLCLGVFIMISYLVFKAGFRKTALLLLLFLVFLVELVMVASWMHFENFDRFMGAFAMQMMLQDGAQLLSFTSKMPSSINRTVLLAAALVFVLQIIIVFVRGKISEFITAIMAPASLLGIVVSVVAATIWNHAESIPDMNDLRLENALQQVKDSEFLMLTSRSGPFTEIANSVSDIVFSSDEKLSIKTSRLLERKAELAIPDADIKKYNVVYILVESMQPGVLEAYGGNPAIMPTVNELSKEALVYGNMFAQSSHSNYADISSVSGQYPLRSMNIHFYPELETYPKSLPYDMLKPLGYKVGLFSSQNERWGQMENYLSSPSIDIFSHVGSTKVQSEEGYGGIEVSMLEGGQTKISYNDFMYQGTGDEIERLDGETTDIALDWLSAQGTQDPFFMYFNFQAAHSPFNALPDDFDPVFFTEDDSNAERVRQGYTYMVPLDYVVKAYWDSLNYVDQNVARVVNYLKSTGQHENTIYVVSSDTSIRFSANLIGNGGDLLPDVLNIPAVVKIPGVREDALIPEPAQQIDLMPTVLSAIGVGPHPASQGVSLLDNRDPDRVVYAVAQTPAAHQYSAIYRDWQLVHDFNIDKYSFNYLGQNREADDTLSAKDADWLIERLAEWRKAQIAYYSSPSVYSRYYPPVFESALWQSGEKQVLVTENDRD